MKRGTEMYSLAPQTTSCAATMRSAARVDFAQTLARGETGRGGTWSPDGTILFASMLAGAPLYRVSATGGEPLGVTSSQLRSQQTPTFLPDGRHFLFTVLNADAAIRGVYLGRLDGSETRRLIDAENAALYTPSGHLLFVREGSLFAQRLDLGRLELMGSPYAVSQHAGLGINGASIGFGNPLGLRHRHYRLSVRFP
jgi:hypothetical protein